MRADSYAREFFFRFRGNYPSFSIHKISPLSLRIRGSRSRSIQAVEDTQEVLMSLGFKKISKDEFSLDNFRVKVYLWLHEMTFDLILEFK